jgi:hypothetical protein
MKKNCKLISFFGQSVVIATLFSSIWASDCIIKIAGNETLTVTNPLTLSSHLSLSRVGDDGTGTLKLVGELEGPDISNPKKLKFDGHTQVKLPDLGDVYKLYPSITIDISAYLIDTTTVPFLLDGNSPQTKYIFGGLISDTLAFPFSAISTNKFAAGEAAMTAYVASLGGGVVDSGNFENLFGAMGIDINAPQNNDAERIKTYKIATQENSTTNSSISVLVGGELGDISIDLPAESILAGNLIGTDSAHPITLSPDTGTDSVILVPNNTNFENVRINITNEQRVTIKFLGQSNATDFIITESTVIHAAATSGNEAACTITLESPTFGSP